MASVSAKKKAYQPFRLVLIKLSAVPENYLVTGFIGGLVDVPIRQIILFDKFVKRWCELFFYLWRIWILRNVENLASHDLEDIITVIDGRAEIIEEISSAPEDVRNYISGKIRGLLHNRQFLDALPGYLLPDDASQGRLRILTERLTQIAEMNRSSAG